MPGCPRGWKLTANYPNCYWFSNVTEKLGQNEAALACTLKDSRLLSLSSEEERDALSDVLLTPYKEEGLDVEWWSSGKWTGGKWKWLAEGMILKVNLN